MPLTDLRPVALTPLVFGGRAGWLHEAAGGPGVVIAGPPGFEGLAAHRFLRILADRLALAGRPVLRFDWTGTGDSGGTLAEATLDLWRADLDAAIDELKAATGTREVSVIGMRLGALIAAGVVAGRDDIRDLVLLAPPASGRALAREMTAMARLIDGALPPVPEGLVRPPAGITSVAGFGFPAGLMAAIAALGWPPPEHAARRLAVPDPQMPPPGFLDAWRAAGCAVETRPFTGLSRMMCDPTAGEVALDVLAATVDWIAAGPSVAPAFDAGTARPSRLDGDGWSEERVTFGPGGRLAGVWCRPAEGVPVQAMIFANAGAIGHGGWAGMTVDHARRLARAGAASLRMDFAEIGDSTEAAAGPRGYLYDRAARADLADAVHLAAAEGFGDIVLVGTCSGAHHAFHVAAAEPAVTGLVLVNILCFLWGPSYAIGLNAWKHAKSFDTDLRRRTDAAAAPADRLARLALEAARRAAKAVLAAMKSGWAARLAGLGVNRVERTVRALARRGVRVTFVSSTGDASLAEIARYLGPGAEKVMNAPGVGLVLVPAADHTLTPLHARAHLGDVLAAMAVPREDDKAGGAVERSRHVAGQDA